MSALFDAAADACLVASAVIAARAGPKRPGLLSSLQDHVEALRNMLEPRCDPLIHSGLQRDKHAFGLLVFAIEDFMRTGADPDDYPARVLASVVLRINQVIAGSTVREETA